MPISNIRPARADEIAVLSALDDDASKLFAEHGLPIELSADHAFARAELARWQRCAQLGQAFLAVDESGEALGFAALDVVDGAPYLEQLDVRRAAMRRGIGARLLAHSADWARSVGGEELWLTTYGHLPFNRPYYERHGYELVPEALCGPGIRAHLDEQRKYLPAPEQRVAMRRRL